jgi:hypothetical protein
MQCSMMILWGPMFIMKPVLWDHDTVLTKLVQYERAHPVCSVAWWYFGVPCSLWNQYCETMIQYTRSLSIIWNKMLHLKIAVKLNRQQHQLSLILTILNIVAHFSKLEKIHSLVYMYYVSGGSCYECYHMFLSLHCIMDMTWFSTCSHVQLCGGVNLKG